MIQLPKIPLDKNEPNTPPLDNYTRQKDKDHTVCLQRIDDL